MGASMGSRGEGGEWVVDIFVRVESLMPVEVLSRLIDRFEAIETEYGVRLGTFPLGGLVMAGFSVQKLCVGNSGIIAPFFP